MTAEVCGSCANVPLYRDRPVALFSGPLLDQAQYETLVTGQVHLLQIGQQWDTLASGHHFLIAIAASASLLVCFQRSQGQLLKVLRNLVATQRHGC